MFGTGELAEKLLKLRKQTDGQQRIITTFSYRYLLEKLPPEGPESATRRWEMFWDAI
jgi:hypothetical protein